MSKKSSKAARDNRANQLNPNNPTYSKSRQQGPPATAPRVERPQAPPTAGSAEGEGRAQGA